jgi:hypothetical protein
VSRSGRGRAWIRASFGLIPRGVATYYVHSTRTWVARIAALAITALIVRDFVVLGIDGGPQLWVRTAIFAHALALHLWASSAWGKSLVASTFASPTDPSAAPPRSLPAGEPEGNGVP